MSTRNLFPFVMLSLLGTASTSAACRYYELVNAGAMSKDVADKYCAAEKIKAQGEARYQLQTARCHSTYKTGGKEHLACLDAAQKELQASISKVQEIMKEEDPREAKEKKVRDGEVTTKDGDVMEKVTRKNGKRNGPYERREGKVSLERGTYVNDLLEGKYEDISYFDQDASPKYRGKENERRVYTYSKGKRQGPFERYEEGKLVEKGEYTDHEPSGTWEYLRNGTWEKKIYCPNGMVTDTAEGGGDCSKDSVGG